MANDLFYFFFECIAAKIEYKNYRPLIDNFGIIIVI